MIIVRQKFDTPPPKPAFSKTNGRFRRHKRASTTALQNCGAGPERDVFNQRHTRLTCHSRESANPEPPRTEHLPLDARLRGHDRKWLTRPNSAPKRSRNCNPARPGV